jgi:hypothetical protein
MSVTKGKGTIGLIAEGQALDAYLTTIEDKKLAKSITKFMHTFSKVARKVHQNIPVGQKDVILTALREYYQVEFKVEFGFRLAKTSQGTSSADTEISRDNEKKIFTLGMGYIKRLTSPQFTPTTKTQLSILRKKTAST